MRASLAYLAVCLTGIAVADTGPYGQLLLAYYSGVAPDTMRSGGINSISLAFFSPLAMAGTNCNFGDLNTPCVKAASSGGSSVGYQWIKTSIKQAVPQLSSNTAPKPNGRPTVFVSFGGLSEGGSGWDTIFSDTTKAKQFGENAGAMVKHLTAEFNQTLFVGIDLDIEGTATKLPQFQAFITSFRAVAPQGQYPLMICALSGLADPDSSDYYKVGLLQQFGPSKGGIDMVNMMVNNQASSCNVMSNFWRASGLDFLPPHSKALGVWGENLPVWMLANPGCSDGSDPLFPWIKTNGANIAIWQWWLGSTSDISALLDQVRQGTPAAPTNPTTNPGPTPTPGPPTPAAGCSGKAGGMYCIAGDTSHYEICPQNLLMPCAGGTCCQAIGAGAIVCGFC